MTDITQYVPEESPVVSAIYSHYKKVGDSEPARGYLGASIIGHSCARFLWYTFRACVDTDFPGRLYRLFETGDLEEIRLVKDLRAIGCTVHEVDPDTGEQFSITDIGGHFSGHMDGCALGIPGGEKSWSVLEFKTHNAKSFAKLKKEGVEKAKPQHYAQIMAYMHATGMTRALYLAVNKDTDEIFAERVHYDKEKAEDQLGRAERIIFATTPPERIATREDWYECSYCDARSICWGSITSALPIPAVSCRQCCHATPTLDGNAHWVCEKHGRGLSENDQARACEDHLVLPGLIGFAEATDYGKGEYGDYIEFAFPSGSKWRHGRPEGGQLSTRELTTLPVSMLVNPFVVAAKGYFDAEATGFCADDILNRYPESDSRVVWKGPIEKLAEVWLERYKEDLSSLTPIAKCDAYEYQAAEFEGARVAISWTHVKQRGSALKAEIREGVE